MSKVVTGLQFKLMGYTYCMYTQHDAVKLLQQGFAALAQCAHTKKGAARPRPAHYSFAIPTADNNDYRGNPAKNPSKIRGSVPLLIQFNNATAGGTVNLKVSYKIKMKFLTPSVFNPSNPSLCPLPSRFLGQYDYYNETESIHLCYATDIRQDDRQSIYPRRFYNK